MMRSDIQDHDHIPCSKNQDEEEGEDENEKEESSSEDDRTSRKRKGSRSSSNSTVEESENSKKGGSVRQYVRSKTPRLRWTPDLHLRFVHAIQRLGGPDRATPKLVLQLMNIKGLSIAHVKSHLQMFRSKKIEDPDQGMIHGGDHGDQNIYNLSQLPIMHSFNPRHSSSYNMGGTRSGYGLIHGSVTQRIFGANNHMINSPRNYDFHRTSISYNPSPHQFQVQETTSSATTTQVVINCSDNNMGRACNNNSNNNNNMSRKRSNLDSDCDLDLDLSLSLKVAESDHVDETNSLSLSLWPSSSSPNSKSSRLKEGDHGDGDRRRTNKASTLDLTL